MTSGTANQPDDTCQAKLVETLVYDYQARVRAFLFSRTGSRETADDLAQEVFLVVMRRIQDFDATRPAWPWLVGIARHKLHEHWRQAAREAAPDAVVALARAEQERLDDAATAAAGAAEGEALTALRECCSRLDASGQRLVNLTYVDGLTSEQIAQRLNRTAVAVRVALHRLRAALAECVSQRLQGANV